MKEIFSINFLLIAFLASIFSAASTSLLSTFVTLKKISYFGEAISHIAFAGIAFALLINSNVNLVTLIFIIIITIVIGYISQKYQFEETNITTIFLSVSMALGIIILSFKKDYTVDIASYLFGNILLVTKTDLIYLIILFGINSIFLLLFFKELFYLCYNEEVSKIFKINTTLVYYIFLIIVSVNIVISVKIIGIIMITAQLLLPGITSLNLTKKVKKAILLSVLISIFSSITGFYFSYLLNIPSGATIVLILFMFFIISIFYKNYMNKNLTKTIY